MKSQTLTNCPACKKEISASAITCIHCGHPIGAIEKEEEEKNKYFTIYGLFIPGIVLIWTTLLITTALTGFRNNNDIELYISVGIGIFAYFAGTIKVGEYYAEKRKKVAIWETLLAFITSYFYVMSLFSNGLMEKYLKKIEIMPDIKNQNEAIIFIAITGIILTLIARYYINTRVAISLANAKQN